MNMSKWIGTRAAGARINMIAASLPLLLLALVIPAGAGEGNRAPELTGDAARLKVEAGNKVAFHTYAAGVQIYRWNGASWTFVAPEAVLAADAGGEGIVGIHYAG